MELLNKVHKFEPVKSHTYEPNISLNSSIVQNADCWSLLIHYSGTHGNSLQLAAQHSFIKILTYENGGRTQDSWDVIQNVTTYPKSG